MTSPSQPTSPSVDAETLKNNLASSLVIAWDRYVSLFGEPPHGTGKQMRSLLSFVPTAALAAPRVEPVALSSPGNDGPSSPDTSLPAIIEVLRSVHSALDRSLGDSDVTHIENDDELCEEYPVQWAAEWLMRAIDDLEQHVPAPAQRAPGWIDQNHQIDRYGVALMMIGLGCADPAELATRVLSEFGVSLPSTERSSSVPQGYSKLPAGVICKCWKMWREPDGSAWCCLPDKTSAHTSPNRGASDV